MNWGKQVSKRQSKSSLQVKQQVVVYRLGLVWPIHKLGCRTQVSLKTLPQAADLWVWLG